jgi:CMP-N-acetylneuraminic acid synthetase
MTEVLRYDDSQIGADVYVQTHSTNPFLKPATIERALAEWQTPGHHYDSLFSVQKLQGRLWDSTVRPVNHNPWLLLRTQDLPPLYLENSNLYIFTAELLRTTRRRIGDRPRLFEMEPLEAIDIDDEQTFQLAEALWRAGGLV